MVMVCGRNIVKKEFRGIMPTDGQTWRELYLVCVYVTKNRLHSIISNISSRRDLMIENKE